MNDAVIGFHAHQCVEKAQRSDVSWHAFPG
jgi:hypothetical protein